MSPGAWRRLQPSELPELEAFLRSREEEAAGFIGRLLRDGRLRFLPPLRGLVAILPAGDSGSPPGRLRIAGAILRTSTGLAFPLLPARDLAGEAGGHALRLPRQLGDRLASIVGPEGDVERLEAGLRLRPLVKVAYHLMTRPADSLPLPRPPAIPGLRIRPAGPDDLDELCPLQEAYEREEVLTPIHSFDPEGSRASLARSLRDQVIVEGRLDGVAVAKAATNARAFRLDQVGGVFVAPPYRRRGIGTAVVMGLLAALEAQGRGTVLFVKRGNEAAKALYDSLAYTVQGGYRADYFIP